jgi:predicted  nucleic acid-binding Zn-ribbon protein
LRRDEFVALNTWQIQQLKPRMTEAEERIYKLEQELQELKSKLI